MGVVNPLTREQAAPEVQEVFDKIAERAAKIPNMFAAMAHRPDVLKAFLPLYKMIINQGTVEAKYKELHTFARRWSTAANTARGRIPRHPNAPESPPNKLPRSRFTAQPLFDEKEKATILYADRVTRAATTIRTAELEGLHKFYDEGQIVELTLAVCMANFTNRFNDALENIPTSACS